MENIRKRSPKSKIIVNTKSHHLPYVGLIARTLPMAKIIYCHRDPMDNCMSIQIRNFEKHWPRDLRSIASYYVFYKELMAHWRRLYGDRILSVRYEDLVTTPAQVGDRIFSFCGLDRDPTTLRHRFRTNELGQWKRYERYLEPLRQALDEFTGTFDREQPQPTGDRRLG